MPLSLPPLSFSIARMAIGFGLMAAVTAGASASFSYTQAPASYARQDMLRAEAFSPWTGPAHRHVIIGSCEVSLPIVANDMDKPGIPPRNEVSAWLGNVLNFVLRNGYDDQGRDGFYDVSAPNTNLTHQAQLLYYASRVPGLSSIIFVNGLGLETDVGPDDALEAVAALERMADDLPAAAPAIQAFAETLRTGTAFQEGERLHPHWRASLDPVTATIEAPWSQALSAQEQRLPANADWRARIQRELVRTKAVVNAVLGGSARLAHLALTPTGFETRRRDEALRRELDWAKTMTDRPGYRAVVERIDNPAYLDGPEQRAQRLWLEMLAAVAEAKHARLVIYAQPMLAVPPDAYAAEFRPHYMDRVRQWLAPYHPVIIDHTLDHDLGLRDFALTCPAGTGACTAGPFVATGYNANIIGRYRQARLLLEALREAKVLDGLQRREGVAWAGFTPRQDRRCVDYVGQQGACTPW